ncbi:MAG: 16S rRNA (adenine(1518)-N(6)/adenine(1519)-N(6))-dimethyltransferase RsmA [Clostridia bacterium]|nr:16S rRNA (adenine(1518)-N(6)/adenine(1519)-N(6))-dimethyltransferase RsmA [Clostridia bacterium]
MNLADPATVRELLFKNGFSFKKSLGQNFLIDPSVCPAMAASASDENTGVLEIGPGIGVLTTELAKHAKKVLAVELDERLQKILPVTLQEHQNITVLYGDVMKMNLTRLFGEHFHDCDSIAVCANLPYYLTSPLVMKLLEERLPIRTITVMVQKEAAERLCAPVGTREAGAVSVAVRYFSDPEILFTVGRNAFTPPPKVDSAVIRLTVRQTPPVTVKDEKQFFRFVKSCFAQRRKTLVNTVSNTTGVSKDAIRAALASLGLAETVRSEQLTLEQLAQLSEVLA